MLNRAPLSLLGHIEPVDTRWSQISLNKAAHGSLNFAQHALVPRYAHIVSLASKYLE